MTTTKRQLSFYAESDVDLYLSYMTPGSKTAIVNESIRSRMVVDAMVDLNDGKKPINFGLLSDENQSEVYSNLILKELSKNDVDDHIWEIIRETASRNWKDNTRRYLTLHHAKFKEPFRIKRLRSQKERDEYMQRAIPRTRFYCEDHATKISELLPTFNFGELKCNKCNAGARYREYK